MSPQELHLSFALVVNPPPAAPPAPHHSGYDPSVSPPPSTNLSYFSSQPPSFPGAASFPGGEAHLYGASSPPSAFPSYGAGPPPQPSFPSYGGGPPPSMPGFPDSGPDGLPGALRIRMFIYFEHFITLLEVSRHEAFKSETEVGYGVGVGSLYCSYCRRSDLGRRKRWIKVVECAQGGDEGAFLEGYCD